MRFILNCIQKNNYNNPVNVDSSYSCLQGKGIFLFQRLKDLSDWRAKECVISPESQDLDTPICPQSFVVQKYIDDPYLLGGYYFSYNNYIKNLQIS